MLTLQHCAELHSLRREHTHTPLWQRIAERDWKMACVPLVFLITLPTVPLEWRATKSDP